MDTSDPTLTMDFLVETGKTSFERVLADGQFYFPKVVIEVAGTLHVGMYESDYEPFRHLCQAMCRHGVIDAIGHTADSYWMNVGLEAYPICPKPIQELRYAGLVTNEELFQAETPGIYEALSILLIRDGQEVEAVSIPYTRVGNSIVWQAPIPDKDDASARGRYVRTMKAALRFSRRATV